MAWMPAFSICSTSRSSMVLPAGTTNCAGGRIDHVLGRRAAEHAVAERGHHLAGIDDRLHLEAARRAAVVLGDDAVLRHVDQTPRQIAGVGRLQRRVGEALAGAVGGVEVLHHGQAFLEVRDDRALDDLARRLGHQAAHAGELLHLRRASRGRRSGSSCRWSSSAWCGRSRPSAPRGCAPSSRRRPCRSPWPRRRPPCCTSRRG